MSDNAHIDVVVVGAGFTGLSAAHELKKAGLGIVVLEARSRVGGRVESRRNGLGERVDTGGQFFCDDMREVSALAKALGLPRVETHLDGRMLTQPAMGDAELERTYLASMALRERLDGASADELGVTIAEWLAGQPEGAGIKAAFRSMIEGLWCLPIAEIPAWAIADDDNKGQTSVSELQYFLPGTMHALAERLAATLGDAVLLGAPVRSIERRAEGVRVATDRGAYDGRAALVAVPPVMASRIAQQPALPAPLAEALALWRSGTVIKLLLRYATPFWRKRGLSGMVAWRDPPSLFVFNVGRQDGPGMLVFFIGGPQALAWRGNGEAWVKREVTARLVSAFGAEASEPLDVQLRDWTGDEWSGGGYGDMVVAVDRPDAADILRAGAPPVFFAASELSPSFPGYIEGAIVAGRQAARKIVARLQSPIATSASGS